MNGQILLNYFNTPVLALFGWRERIRLYLFAFCMIAASVLAIHQFFPENSLNLELVLHAILIGLGYTVSLALLDGLVDLGMLLRNARRSKLVLNISHVWLLAFAAFIVGYLLLQPVRPYYQDLHPDPETGLTAFIQLLPVWVLVVYIYVQMLCNRTLAYETEELRTLNASLERRLQEAKQPAADLTETGQTFLLETGRMSKAIDPANIVHISVEEHYCFIFVKAEKEVERLIVKLSLKEALAQLPDTMFVQIHRAHVVNLQHIAEVRRQARGYTLLMDAGQFELPISRRRLNEVMPKLTGTL